MKLLLSKIRQPEPEARHIQRTHLIELLEQNRTSDLILLLAPAGHGKTVLASQLLRRKPPSAQAWLHLETEDGDPKRLFRYILGALSQCFPPLNSSGLQKAVQNDRSNLSDKVESLFLFLQEYDFSPIWLVLDNWERINDHQAAGELVCRMIELSNGRLKLILTSREKPSFKFSRWQHDGKLMMLTREDLAFSFSEFTEAVEKRLGKKYVTEDIEELWAVTKGWCVAVGPALEKLRQPKSRPDSAVLGISLDDLSLKDYLEEELLGQHPSDFVDFLTRTSLLETLSIDNCRLMGEQDDCVIRHLGHLKKSSIPCTVMEADAGIRLHPLARQGLRQILRERTPQDRLKKIHAASADCFEQQGMILEAVNLLLEGENYKRALDVLYRHHSEIDLRWTTSQIKDVLEQIPEEFKSETSYEIIFSLLLFRKWSTDRTLEYLSKRVRPEQFSKGNDVLAALWCRYQNLRICMEENAFYDEILSEWNSIDSEFGPFKDNTYANIEYTISYSAFMQNKFSAARQHLERAISFSNQMDDTFSLEVGASLAQTATFTKPFGEATKDLQIAIEKTKQGGANAVLRDIYLYLVVVCQRAGYFCELFQISNESMDFLSSAGINVPHSERSIGFHRGIGYWYTGQKKKGLELLDKYVDEERRQRPNETSSSSSTSTSLKLLRFFTDGNVGGISNLPPIDESSKGFVGTHTYLLLACKVYEALLSNDIQSMEESAQRLYDYADPEVWTNWHATACFFLSYVASEKGSETECCDYISRALMALSAREYKLCAYPNDFLIGFVLVKSAAHEVIFDVASTLYTSDAIFDVVPVFEKELLGKRLDIPQKTRVLRAATQLGIMGLNQCCDKLREISPELSDPIEEYHKSIVGLALPPLELRTLGEFSAQNRWGEISFSRVNGRRLFQLLISKYPSTVHREVIMETLWPKSTPENAWNSLRMCVSRLRRVLDPYFEGSGVSYIEYEDEHYRLIIPEGSTVDVLEFRRLTIESLTNGTRRRALSKVQTEGLKRALSLYRGEYLPKERYTREIEEIRLELASQYQRVCLAYGSEQISSDNFTEAIFVLERALRFDPLWQDGVKLLMEARVKNGELYKALRLFRDYEKRIQQELDLPPDEELKAYFEGLVRPQTD